MNTFKEQIPVAGAGHALSGVTVPHDTDANWGAYLRPSSDTGNWISGLELKAKARAGAAIINLGTVPAAATDFKCALLEADDANGTNGAEKTVLLTLDNTGLGTGNKFFVRDVAFGGLSDTKYYALGCASKGATPATDGVPCAATLVYLDPTHT